MRRTLLASSSRRTFLQAGGAIAGALAWGGSPLASLANAADKPRGAGLKLGIATYTFRKFDLDQTLAMTKRVALEYVCLKSFHLALDASPQQIAQAAEKVKAAGLVLYGCGVVSMKKPADVEQTFNYAKLAGMKTIVAAPAPELLPQIEGLVKQHGIQVAIHNHGPGDKTWPTPQSIFEKIEKLDRRIGICIDIGHTVRYGVDLLETTRRYGSRFLDVHLKDVTAADAKGHGTQVGRGIIDIPGFLKLLLESGFQGIASYEYEEEASDPLPGLAESVGYTRGVLRML